MSSFLYERIANTLRERIAQRQYPTGRLPAERTLGEEFQVQRATVRKALEILVQDGLLLRDSTRGTCIAPRYLAKERASERAAAPDSNAQKGGVLLIVRTLEESTVSSTIFRGLSNFLGTQGIPVYWHEPEEMEPVDAAHLRKDYLPSDELLASRNIRGIAIWPRSWTPLERMRRLRERMPIVLLDRRMPGFEADFVGYRDFEAGQTVTRHLMQLGHRRIGYLSGESWASTVQERIAGYAAALMEGPTERNLSPRTLHQDGGSRHLSAALLESFLAGEGDPLTAIICANDIMAARLIQYLRSTGRRVPEDVAVTGSGNLLPAMMDAFGITTFAAPIEELGWAAGDLLITRMKGGGGMPIREIAMPMPLIVRQSCGSGLASSSLPSRDAARGQG